MIHTLFYVALWFLGLFIAFKMGQASEQIRVQSVLRSTLHERGLQTKSGRAPGAPRSSSIEEEPLAESDPHRLAENDAPSREHAPSQSVLSLYDGEKEAALDPRPVLSVVEGLEERPGLRVVEPS